MSKIKNAIILAAGLGSRLKGRTEHIPKGFLELGKYAIIEESIMKLFSSGVSKIYIGTGHADEHYLRLAKKYAPFIECRRNDAYASTGSMSTLAIFSDLNEDFLLLESDLIYEKAALEILHQHPGDTVILASGQTNSGDEVYIESDSKHQLISMSKKASELKEISGELVGISKIAGKDMKKMCAILEEQLTQGTSNGGVKVDYETTLIGLAKSESVYIEKKDDLAWAEIDDESHLKRAKEEIYPRIQQCDAAYTPPRNILLNPGPATTTDSVKRAQVVGDVCPREIEFGDLMQNVKTKLTNFAANSDDFTTVMFGGSGTAAVEAAIASIPGNKELLIINNGAYGKRMAQIATVFSIKHQQFVGTSIDPLDWSKIEDLIKNNNFAYVAIVHNETTTGLLNDLKALSDLKKKFGFEVIVDAMSSYGALPLDMVELDLDYVISSSNKNIQGMAGLGFVLAKLESLEHIKENPKKSFYLDLYAQHAYFEKTKQLRFTPPVQTFYALNQAIVELQAETIEQRYERYSTSWQTLVGEMKKLGFDHLVKAEHHSRIITAFFEPKQKSYHFNTMHDVLFRKGLTIYPGKLDDLNTFRISNIGDLTEGDILTFISEFKKYLHTLT